MKPAFARVVRWSRWSTQRSRRRTEPAGRLYRWFLYATALGVAWVPGGVAAAMLIVGAD